MKRPGHSARRWAATSIMAANVAWTLLSASAALGQYQSGPPPANAQGGGRQVGLVPFLEDCHKRRGDGFRYAEPLMESVPQSPLFYDPRRGRGQSGDTQQAPSNAAPAPGAPGAQGPQTPTSPQGRQDAQDMLNMMQQNAPNAGLDSLSSATGGAASPTSGAPNMIGDLFNAGSLDSNFRLRVQADPILSSGSDYTRSFTDPNALVNGITVAEPGGLGLRLTALDAVGDLISVGESTVISASELDNQLGSPTQPGVLRTTQTASEVSAASSGGSVRAAEPIPQSFIRSKIQQLVAREAPEIGSRVNVNDLFTLDYDQTNSVIGLSSSGGSITADPEYVYVVAVQIPTPSPGSVVGRVTIADNNSPLPRCRVFVDYNYFDNATVAPGGLPVNRVTFGYEKTICDGMMSLETRAPMAVTLSSDLRTDLEDVLGYEFGDMAFILKRLLLSNETGACSAGLIVTVPTANDFSLTLANNTSLVRIDNRSVHLMPFVGVLSQPNDCSFLQAFAQLDFDVSGNMAQVNTIALEEGEGGALVDAGNLRDQTLLRLNVSAGRWLYRSDNACNRLQAVAAALEAHYTRTISDADFVDIANVTGAQSGLGSLTIGNPHAQLDVVNLTMGGHFFCGKSVVTAAYGVPVTDDRVFDGELRLFWNRYF